MRYNERFCFFCMHVSKGRTFLWGVLFCSVVFAWILFPKNPPAPISVPPLAKVSVGENDDFFSVMRDSRVSPVRANDKAPIRSDILASGILFPAHPEFEVRGEVMILRDNHGKYFLQFQDFSLPPLLDLQIFFANDAEGRDAVFSQNLTAHKGNLLLPLPNDLNPYENAFVRIFWPRFNQLVAVAEMK